MQIIETKFSTLPDEYVATLRGRFVDERHFETPIGGEDAIVLKPNGEPLLVFKRNVLPMHVCRQAFPALKQAATVTDNRGLAAGGNRYRKVRRNGTRSMTMRARKVRSGIIGHYDRYPRHDYCRTTAYTRDNVAGWKSVLPMIRAVNDVFRRELPARYAAQMRFVERTSPDFVIPQTVFTTVTVNRNFQTAVHRDSGDLPEGFGVMSVLSAGNYDGGYLVFPKYMVAVDMRTCAVLLADVHELHGNTAIVGVDGEYERISTVFYYRRKMIQCGSAAEEMQRRKSEADLSQ